MTGSRILVVDDDRANCAIVSKMLSERGYEVDIAYDGPAALELAESHPYRLALLDYQMPEMDGVELFGRLRQLRPELVGVLLTAHARIETIYPAMGVGLERVLAKPPDANELLPLVEELMPDFDPTSSAS